MKAELLLAYHVIGAALILIVIIGAIENSIKSCIKASAVAHMIEMEKDDTLRKAALEHQHQKVHEFNEQMLTQIDRIIKAGGRCSNCGQLIVQLTTPTSGSGRAN